MKKVNVFLLFAFLSLFAIGCDEIATFQVTFDVDGGTPTVVSQTIEIGGVAIEPADPTKEGYTFEGWFVSDTATEPFAFSTLITENITLKARWEAIEDETPVTVTFVIGYESGTAPSAQEIAAGTTATRPTDPTRADYTFLGWYVSTSSSVEFNFQTAITENITLYAKWEIITFDVTFDIGYEEGTNPAAQEIAIRTSPTQPTEPERDGYEFLGWYVSLTATEPFVFTTAVNEDITLYAKWEIAKAEVTFNLGYTGGENPAMQEITLGDIAIEPTDPERENYTFLGWFISETATEPFEFSTTITDDIVLLAKWEMIVLSVDEVMDSGLNGESYFVEGLVLGAGFNDLGNMQVIYIQDKDSGNIAIVHGLNILGIAFQKNDLILINATFTNETTGAQTGRKSLTYNSGITVVSSNNELFDYKETAIEITSHEDMLYHFAIENVGYGKVYHFSGEIYYNSNWLNYQTDKTQYIRVHLNPNATSKTDISFGADKMVCFSDYGNRDIMGLNWLEEHLNITPENYPGTAFPGFSKEVGFYAVLKNAIDSYYFMTILEADDFYSINTVDFDLDYVGGTAPSEQKILDGGQAVEPEDPTREGYIFQGWFASELATEPFDFSALITDDVTITARWEVDPASQVVTVSFDLGYEEGVPPAEQTLTTGDPAIKPEDPTRGGYEFVNWYASTEAVEPFDFSTTITENTTLYARWEKVVLSVDQLLASTDIGSSFFVEGLVLSGGYSTSNVLHNIFIQDKTSGNIAIVLNLNELGSSFQVGDLIEIYVELKLETTGAQTNKKYFSYTSDLTVVSTGNLLVDYKQNAVIIASHEDMQIKLATENIVFGQVYFFTGGFYYNSNYLNYQVGGNQNARIHMNENATVVDDIAFGVNNNQKVGINDNGNRTNLGDNWFEEFLGVTEDNYPGTSLPGFYLNGGFYAVLKNADNNYYYMSILSTDDFIKYNNVSFDLGFVSETTPETQIVVEGELALQPDEPIREGYIFQGWFTSELATVPFDFATPITEQITLLAKWEVDSASQVVTVSFDLGYDGGVAPVEQPLNSGDLAIRPDDPAREGYDFIGWFVSELAVDPFDFATPVTDHMTLYARWNKIVVSVDQVLADTDYGTSFFVKGIVLSGGYSTSNVLHNIFVQDQTTGNIAIVTGLTTLGTEFQIGDLIEFNATLNKNLDGNEIGKIYLSYNADLVVVSSGNDLVDYRQNAIVLTSHEDMVNQLTLDTIKYGQVYFIVGGYYYNSNWLNYQTGGNQHARLHMNPAASTTVDYKFGGKIFVLSDNGNRANLGVNWFDTILGITAENYPGVTAPGFYKEGGFYAVLKNSDASYWYLSAISPDDFVDANIVDFDMGFVSEATPEIQIVFEGDLAVQPVDPVREGYIFQGWFVSELATVPFDFATPITEQTTLLAKWEIDSTSEVVTVSFDLGYEDGVPPAEQAIDSGDLAIRPDDPAREGYEFVGWFISEIAVDPFDFATPVTDHTTLYARWNKIVVSVDQALVSTDYGTAYNVKGIVLSGGYGGTNVLDSVFVQDETTGNIAIVTGLTALGTEFQIGDLIEFNATLNKNLDGSEIGKIYLSYNADLVVLSSANAIVNYRDDAIVLTSHEDMVTKLTTETIEFGQVYFFTDGFYYTTNYTTYQAGGNQNVRLHMKADATSLNEYKFGGKIFVLNDNGNRTNLGDTWFEDKLGITVTNYPGIYSPGFHHTGGFYAVLKSANASFWYLSIMSPDDIDEYQE